VSGPIATLDPATPKIPDELWKQSGTPITGWLIRGWIGLVLISAGWILVDVTGTVYPWALAAIGIAAFFAVPALVESLVLARLSAKVDAIELGGEASKAHAVLDELRRNSTAKMLAPHGWLRVQEGRVHLAVGDGRAAAKSFAEAERVSTHPDKHQLISAQAHALVLAGDRKEARELLVKLRKADALADLDHLNLGVVLLSEAGHNQEALGHLQQAREAFGDHPRTLAGLVLALQRCDKTDEAAALLVAAEAAVDAGDDQLAQDLLKRAKKGLRPLLKAKQKRERKSDKPAERSEAPSAEPSSTKPKGKKGRKQSRRDARKKAKTDARQPNAGEQAAQAAERSEEAPSSVESVREGEAREREASVREPVGETPVRDAAAREEAATRETAALEESREAAREQSAREATAREAATREAAAREEAAREAAAREEAARDAAAREEAARDAARRDEAARDAARREEAARDAARREEAARDAARREEAARDVARREEAARDVARREEAARDVARREAAAREASARESAAREEAAREASVRETAAREEAVRAAAHEAAAREAAAREVPKVSTPPESVRPQSSKDDDDDIDLATLALQALGSGSRPKLDESEGGPSASGLRPIEPSASSGSLFRSAVFNEPEKPSTGPSSSLFSLPKFDSVPTFAPPPKPSRGSVLPDRPSEAPAPKPAPAPKLSTPTAPSASVPKPTPKPLAVPGVTPPKLGAPPAPSIPAPKPAAAKPIAPALDDGWGDLGDIDPLPAPPVADKAED
jgi:hypothetical protein